MRVISEGMLSEVGGKLGECGVKLGKNSDLKRV